MVESYLKKLSNAALVTVVDDLVREKRGGSSGRAMYNSYKEKLQSLSVMGVQISRGALYQRVARKYKAEQSNNDPADNPADEASGDPACDSSNNLAGESVVDDPAAAPVRDVTTNHEGEVSRLSSPSTSLDVVPVTPKPKAGRPKGTTDEKKREDKKNHQACIDSIAYDFSTEQTAKKAVNKRCERGFLEALIETKKAEFGVTAKISVDTIQSRVKRGNLDPAHPGT